MSTLTETIEEAQEEAKARGCIIIESDDHLLLLDYDSPEAAALFKERRHMVEALWGITRVLTWPSASGNGHTHMQVMLATPLDVVQRIAVQAALGSDPIRELFAVERARVGKRNPSILFQPVGAVITELDIFNPFADITSL